MCLPITVVDICGNPTKHHDQASTGSVYIFKKGKTKQCVHLYKSIYMHNPRYFYAASTTQPQPLQLCSFYDHSVKYLDISTQKTSLYYWRIYNISAS